MMDEIIKRYNFANSLWSPEYQGRLVTYNHSISVAIIESWRDLPYLVNRIRELEEKLK